MPFPHPQLLRRMIREAATENPERLGKMLPLDLNALVERRAKAAEAQYQSAMAEIPEEQIRKRNRMQRENPLGAMHWRNQYDRQAAEAALAQALEFPEEATTSPQSEA